MLFNSTISFEIAEVSFLYEYEQAIRIEDDWPICHFLKPADEDYDVYNKISFDFSYNLSWLDEIKPIIQMPSYSIYAQESTHVIVFNPCAGHPVAILFLSPVFSTVRTVVLDDTYTKQPLPLCVTAFLLQRVLAMQNSGFIAHGASWSDSENLNGFIFTGNSGVGKSTISRIFNEFTDYTQISDDRVILKMNSAGCFAFGNPFDFKITRISNQCTHVRNIFFLHHSPENSVCKISPANKIKKALQISLLPYWHKEFLQNSTTLVSRFLQCVQMYDLYFKPDSSVISYVTDIVERLENEKDS